MALTEQPKGVLTFRINGQRTIEPNFPPRDTAAESAYKPMFEGIGRTKDLPKESDLKPLKFPF